MNIVELGSIRTELCIMKIFWHYNEGTAKSKVS